MILSLALLGCLLFGLIVGLTARGRLISERRQLDLMAHRLLAEQQIDAMTHRTLAAMRQASRDAFHYGRQ